MEAGEGVASEDWRLECLREDQQLYVLSPRNITVTSRCNILSIICIVLCNNNRLGDLWMVTTRLTCS